MKSNNCYMWHSFIFCSLHFTMTCHYKMITRQTNANGFMVLYKLQHTIGHSFVPMRTMMNRYRLR